MEQHYTIREAARRTGKSESTIKRLVNSLKDQADSADRAQLLPTHEQRQRLTEKSEPFHWKISETLLRQRFPDAFRIEAGEQGSGDPGAVASGQSNRVIDILQRSISKFEQQLDRKDEQLARKDEQIKTLTERVGESHVLIRELQQRLALAAPRPSPDTTVEAETVAHAAERPAGEGTRGAKPASTKKRSSQSTKKGWFSFLRA